MKRTIARADTNFASLELDILWLQASDIFALSQRRGIDADERRQLLDLALTLANRAEAAARRMLDARESDEGRTDSAAAAGTLVTQAGGEAETQAVADALSRLVTLGNVIQDELSGDTPDNDANG